MKGLDAPLLYLLSLGPLSSLLRAPGVVLCRMLGLVTSPAPGTRHGGSGAPSLASGGSTDLSLVIVKMTVCIFGSDLCLHPSSLFTQKIINYQGPISTSAPNILLVNQGR